MVEIFLFKSRFFIQVKNSFFKVRVSIFKSSSFLFKLRCFKWPFFFHVEIFISSREFFFLSRIFSCQGISVQVEILIFSSQDFFSCRDLSIQVDIFQFMIKARAEMFVWIPCWYFPP